MRITARQREIIEEVHARGFMNQWFFPEDVFPERNNQDNAARRTIRALGAKGVLFVDETPFGARYRVNPKEF